MSNLNLPPNNPTNNPPDPLPPPLPQQLMVAVRGAVARATVTPNMEDWTQFQGLMLLGQEEIHMIIVLWHQQPMDVTGPLTQTRLGRLKTSVFNLCLKQGNYKWLTPQWPRNKPHSHSGWRMSQHTWSLMEWTVCSMQSSLIKKLTFWTMGIRWTWMRWLKGISRKSGRESYLQSKVMRLGRPTTASAWLGCR